MTAKRPARFVLPRHGTFCIRLIVPVRFRNLREDQ